MAMGMTPNLTTQRLRTKKKIELELGARVAFIAGVRA
jgi:hypothetical protein